MRAATLFGTVLVSWCAVLGAHGAMGPALEPSRVPAQFVARADASAGSTGIETLAFEDINRRPVGPRGLEFGPRAVALDGHRVRLVGYMLDQHPPALGGLFLAPLPLALGTQDEGLADDVPPSTLFVRLSDASPTPVVLPHLPGVLQFEGELRLRPHLDPVSGRQVGAQLVLDARTSDALIALRLDPDNDTAAELAVPSP